MVLSLALTPFSGGPPASDPSLTADGKMVRWGRQADGPDVLAERDVSIQLHQSDVVAVGEGVVIVVGDDPLHATPHRPLGGLTLHVQTKKDLPLVSPEVPAPTQLSPLLVENETRMSAFGALTCRVCCP